MKYVRKLAVLAVLLGMLVGAGSVSAQSEMSYKQALDALKGGDRSKSVKVALRTKAKEATDNWKQKLVKDIKPFKTASRAAGTEYTFWLVRLPTENPEVVEKEVREVAEATGFNPYKRLQALASRNGDQAFKKRILAESIDEGYVHWKRGIRLAKQVDDPKLQAEAVKVVCMQDSHRAGLLEKEALKFLSSLHTKGVVSGENYLPKEVCVALIKNIVGSSTSRYQTLSRKQPDSAKTKRLASGISAWKSLGSDQFGIEWPE